MKTYSSDQTLHYVFIGGGAGIAESHLRALAQLPAQVVGLSDIDMERGSTRAAKIGAEFFTDHRQMIQKLRPDVAVICTPHPSHPSLAIDCLSMGVHVLTEKPIAVEVAEADAMIEAAEAAGRILAVNFQHRLRPAIEKAKAMIDGGEIGALVRVLVLEPWLRTAAYYRSATWRGSWTTEGGGVLMNQSPHTLDLMCHLAGMPAKVWGWIRTRYHAMECEDTAQAMLEYPNGAPGYFTASTAEAGGQRRIEIVGESATLMIAGDHLSIQRFDPALRDFIENDPNFFNNPGIRTEELDLLANEGEGNHLAVHRDLQQAIAENRQPRCDGREARMSLELANAITLSSYSDHAVSLPLDREAYHLLLNDLKAHTR